MNAALERAAPFILVATWIVVLYVSPRVALCVAAAAILAHGVIGALRRRITVKGSFGPARTYVGKAGVREGIFIAVFGLVFAAMALCAFWLFPLWQHAK